VGGTGSAEPTSLGWYLPAGWRLASRIALHRELAADRAAAGSAGRGVLTGALLQLASLPGRPARPPTFGGAAGVRPHGRAGDAADDKRRARSRRQRPAGTRTTA
jgi:hypothetical protein